MTYESQGAKSHSLSSRRAVAVTLVGQILRFSIQMVALAALSRLLEPADIGLMAMVLAVINVGSVLGDFGLSLSALRASTLTESQKSTLFVANASIGLVVTGLVWFFAPVIGTLFSDPRIVETVRWICPIFFLNGCTVQFRVETNRSLRFGRLATIDVGAQSLALVGSVALAVLGWGITALIAQQLLLSVGALFISIWAAKWIPRFSRDISFHQIRGFVAVGGATTFTQALNYASVNMAPIALGRIAGATSVGFFSRGYQLFALPIQQLAAPLTKVMLPILVRESEYDSFSTRLGEVQRMLTVLLVVPMMLFASMAVPLVSIILGQGWETAGEVVGILALGGIFQGMGYLYYWIYLSKGRAKLLLISELWGRLGGIVAVWFVADFGPLAVAWVLAVSNFIIWATSTFWGMRQLGIAVMPVLRSGWWATVGGVVTFLLSKAAYVAMPALFEVQPVMQISFVFILFVMVFLALALIPSARSEFRHIFKIAGIGRKEP